MAVPPLPKKFQNSLDLAKAIYERWRNNVAKTSGINSPQLPKWDDVDYDTRVSLCDAVEYEVIDVAIDYKNEVTIELDWDSKPTPPAKDPDPTPSARPTPPPMHRDPNLGVLLQYPCYVCGAAPVGVPGDPCTKCAQLIKRLSP